MENVQEINAPTRKAFLPEMALVNPIARNAYRMRFLKEEIVGNRAGLSRWDHETILYKHSTTSGVCDALFVPRPYFRVDGDVRVEGTVVFEIDGEKIIQGPVSDFLVKDMTDPRLDEPFAWPKPQCLFHASRIKEKGPDLDTRDGLFLPNGTSVKISIKTSVVTGANEAHIEVGLLAAQYTTNGTPEPKMWSEPPEARPRY